MATRESERSSNVLVELVRLQVISSQKRRSKGGGKGGLPGGGERKGELRTCARPGSC